jgi:beta-lactamase class A
MTISTHAIIPHIGQAAFSPERAGGDAEGLPSRIKALFESLPGTWTLKIQVMPKRADELEIAVRPDQRVFVASAFKTYVLAARLREIDAPDVVERLESNELNLDDSVWSLGSDVFNPPSLKGLVSERTAAEAMIMHSDNTGTDMVMRAAGVEHIRGLIAELGLKNTQIPESTRAFGAYVFGLTDYKNTTWAQALEAAQRGNPPVHPFLNDVETMASTASDLVMHYLRTIREGFFKNAETLEEYRRILALADGVFQATPLGTSGFAKTGYSDVPGFHARSNAGAMTFEDCWVYFASIINWDSPEQHDLETVHRWTGALRKSLHMIYDEVSRT